MSFDPEHWSDRLGRRMHEIVGKMEELNEKLDRFNDGFRLFTAALCGCSLATCPIFPFRLQEAIMSVIDGKGLPPARWEPLVGILLIAPFALVPLLVIYTRRAVRALDGERPPRALWWMFVSVFFAPFLITPLADEFGPAAYLAALVWWPIGSLAAVAFVLAGAQVDAERQGEKVRATAVNFLWHMGGFVGVILAGRMFPESKVFDEFDTGPPRVAVLMAMAVGAFLLLNYSNVPSGALWETIKP